MCDFHGSPQKPGERGILELARLLDLDMSMDFSSAFQQPGWIRQCRPLCDPKPHICRERRYYKDQTFITLSKTQPDIPAVDGHDRIGKS